MIGRPDPAPKPIVRRRWIVVAGLGFALTALVVAPLLGLDVSGDLTNTTGRVTWPVLLIGVFAAGCAFWWLLVALPRRLSAWRGAVAGVLTAFFSYPLVLTLADVIHRDWTNTASWPSLAERVDSLSVVTVLTLMTSGFASTLILAVVGALMAKLLFGRPPEGWVWQPLGLVQKLAVALAVVIVVGLVGSFVWLSSMSLDLEELAQRVPASTPAKTYDEAIAAYGAIQAAEADLPLFDHCRTTLLTHGNKTARVVVYFHGFTSCPAQGAALAAQLFAAGANVLMPRMVGHGASDPIAADMTELTAAHLVELAGGSIDMARGLGDEVLVVGLSAGGTVAAWAAQERADVAYALPVSPFFGPYLVATWANRAAINLTLMLPDVTLWWNPLENIDPASPGFGLARPTTHALAEIMVLGELVQAIARTTPPKAGRIDMLLNDADVLVNNSLSEQVVSLWRGHGKTVGVATLPFSAHLPHDVINPEEHGSDIDLVYSTIDDLVNSAAPN